MVVVVVVVVAAGAVVLVPVVLIAIVVVGVGVVKTAVVILVVADAVVVVVTGLVGGAFGTGLVILPTDVASVVGDAGGGTSLVVLLAVETAGNAGVTLGDVWEDVGKACVVKTGSVSKRDVDV